jgi:hypothetical protein
MINHVAPLTFESGFFAALDEKPRHAPWWLSCTVSSPFAAFAARLLASDSLAEAVFFSSRDHWTPGWQDQRVGNGDSWNFGYTIH